MPDEAIIERPPVEIPIPSRPGMVALVDPEFAHLAEQHWHINRDGYPMTTVRLPTGEWRKRFMHLFVFDPGTGMKTDHKNRNRLDNRAENLRAATTSQNGQNRTKKGGMSPYKGVTWNRDRKRWQAQIMVKYRQLYLGLFASPEDAASAYDTAARTHHGEFAVTNFEVTDV